MPFYVATLSALRNCDFHYKTSPNSRIHVDGGINPAHPRHGPTKRLPLNHVCDENCLLKKGVSRALYPRRGMPKPKSGHHRCVLKWQLSSSLNLGACLRWWVVGGKGVKWGQTWMSFNWRGMAKDFTGRSNKFSNRKKIGGLTHCANEDLWMGSYREKVCQVRK